LLHLRDDKVMNKEAERPVFPISGKIDPCGC
jgi:hypothetical protein